MTEHPFATTADLDTLSATIERGMERLRTELLARITGESHSDSDITAIIDIDAHITHPDEYHTATAWESDDDTDPTRNRLPRGPHPVTDTAGNMVATVVAMPDQDGEWLAHAIRSHRYQRWAVATDIRTAVANTLEIEPEQIQIRTRIDLTNTTPDPDTPPTVPGFHLPPFAFDECDTESGTQVIVTTGADTVEIRSVESTTSAWLYVAGQWFRRTRSDGKPAGTPTNPATATEATMRIWPLTASNATAAAAERLNA